MAARYARRAAVVTCLRSWSPQRARRARRKTTAGTLNWVVPRRTERTARASANPRRAPVFAGCANGIRVCSRCAFRPPAGRRPRRNRCCSVSLFPFVVDSYPPLANSPPPTYNARILYGGTGPNRGRVNFARDESRPVSKGADSMIVRTLKWTGTLLCLLIAVAFAFSARRALEWHSSDVRHAFGLRLGTVAWVWRPDDWRLEDDPYAGLPGWTYAGYGGHPRLYWWIDVTPGKTWHGVSIPLWMPFAAAAVPTLLLWYRDRRDIRTAIRSIRRWLTPSHPRRVTVWAVAGFCLLHVACLFGGSCACDAAYAFFSERSPPWFITDRIGPLLFWTTPFWGLLWAWWWVRFRNHLFVAASAGRCETCGYDLTGNVSGTCPECGAQAKAR